VDFGEAIANMMASHQSNRSHLHLKDVQDTFARIEHEKGEGSAYRRKALLIGLLSNASPIEAKWISKIITSEMRHGVNLGIFIDALALLTDETRANVETALMLLGDPDELAYGMMRYGRQFTSRLSPTVFKPLRPMLAEQAPDPKYAFETWAGNLIAEIKLDGLRAQVHKRSNDIKIFSRSLRDITEHLPEIVAKCRQTISAYEVILDGEVIATDQDDKPLPFQTLSKRITAEALPRGLVEAFSSRSISLMSF